MCIFFSPNLQLLLPTFSILSVTLVKLVIQTKKKKEKRNEYCRIK